MNKTKKYIKYIAMAQVCSDKAKACYQYSDYVDTELHNKKAHELAELLYSKHLLTDLQFKKIKKTYSVTALYRMKEQNICNAIDIAKSIHKANNKYKCFFHIAQGYRNIVYFDITYQGKKQISFHTDNSYNIWYYKKYWYKRAFKTYWDNSNTYNTHWDKKSSYNTIYNLVENINELI